MPGGSFSGMDSAMYDLKQTHILSIERTKPDKFQIELRNSEGNIRTGYIRARNRMGVQELNVIENHAKEFINKSYDTFIYFSFERVWHD